MKAIRKTGKQETAKPEQENPQSAVVGRATTPVGAVSLRSSDALGARSSYLYAIAALDGPARWMTSKRLKPISRHHFSKSAAE
jgi:hypothetical protein